MPLLDPDAPVLSLVLGLPLMLALTEPLPLRPLTSSILLPPLLLELSQLIVSTWLVELIFLLLLWELPLLLIVLEPPLFPVLMPLLELDALRLLFVPGEPLMLAETLLNATRL